MANILLLISMIMLFSCGKNLEQFTKNINMKKNVCACTFDNKPVCGSDGNTYDNTCLAECKGITTWTLGACNKKCNKVANTGLCSQVVR